MYSTVGDDGELMECTDNVVCLCSVIRYMGIGLSASGVNLNRLPGESVCESVYVCVCVCVLHMLYIKCGISRAAWPNGL